MNIDIIVVRYGLPEIENRCLESVVKHTAGDYGLRVIDNFVKKIPLTKVWNNAAVMSDADWLVFLNSDCVVPDKWLEKLLVVIDANPNIGAIGPATNNAPTNQCNFQHRLHSYPPFINVDRVNESAEILFNEFGTEFRKDEITGFCYMINNRALQDIEYFNEQFPFYGQESMANHALRNAGYRVGWSPGIFVYHEGEAYKGIAKNEGRDLGKEKSEAMEKFLKIKSTPESGQR